MNINEKLKNLYLEYWSPLVKELQNTEKKKYTNPLLIEIDEEKIKRADLRVMIFGQETKGWGDKKGSGIATDVQVGMDRYKMFFGDGLNGNFYKGYRRSAFWKGFRFFQSQLKILHPNKEIAFIWNNISKIGKPDHQTGVDSVIRDIEHRLFPVIEREIRIIKPDIVIFLTGPRRDDDIKFNFPDVDIIHTNTTNTIKQLAMIQSKLLPEISVRMYHPAFYKGFNAKLKANAISFLTCHPVNDISEPFVEFKF